MAAKQAKNKPADAPPKTGTKGHVTSRLAAGKDLFFEGTDERTAIPKAIKANYRAILSDLGGEEHTSTLQRSLARRAAVLDAFAINLEAKASNNEQISITEYATAVNTLHRLSCTLGCAPRLSRGPLKP